MRQQIINAYLAILQRKKDYPTTSEMLAEYDVTRDEIRKEFGSFKFLRDYILANHKKDLNFTTAASVFADERSLEIKAETKKRYIVTTAVASSPVHSGFMKSLDLYAEKNDAQIVIMPCESKTNSFNDETAVFDPIFNNSKYLFVTKDTKLCNNISLCSIQVSANQVKPITGLARIGKRSGSYVFASPKQFLEYYPNGTVKGRNYAIMTPGACTRPHYFTETFVSKRLSYIAENDHTIGAIIIEIEDDGNHFHFRQIQADEEGNFIDLGTEYKNDGSTSRVTANVVLGDLHGVNCDFDALDAFASALSAKNIEPKSIFIHDLFDGQSINHHEQTIGAMSERHREDRSNLADELYKTGNFLVWINHAFKPKEIFVVKSNHDEFLDRYLKEGRYIADPENHYTALKIAVSMFDGEDTLKAGLEYAKPSLNLSNVHFLSREHSVKIADLELGAHGDLGINGAKPNLNSLEIGYGRCVVGHNHSAAIQRGVFRVGTMSLLNMKYNRGMSSWTATNALVYDNGQVQLLNYMNGKYFL